MLKSVIIIIIIILILISLYLIIKLFPKQNEENINEINFSDPNSNKEENKLIKNKIEKSIYKKIDKNNIDNFYKGAPIKGIYIEYLKKIKDYCLSYLEKKANIENKALVVDFDDTLVWTSPHDPLSINIVDDKKFGKVFSFPILEPIVQIVKYAKKLGYYIFIITARPPSSYISTVYNCHIYNIPYDSIFTSSFYGEMPSFKYKLRDIIETHNPKELIGLNTFQLLTKKNNLSEHTNIIMSIGDNWYDVINLKKGLGIKLPSPDDFNCYSYYKNRVVELL